MLTCRLSGLMSPADLSKRDAMGCSCLHRAARTGVPEARAKEVYPPQKTNMAIKKHYL